MVLELIDLAQNTDTLTEFLCVVEDSWGEEGLEIALHLMRSGVLVYRLHRVLQIDDLLRLRLIAKDKDIKKLVVEGKVTVIDFFAEWCGPCKDLGEALEKLNSDTVVIKRIDIDKEEEIAERFDVSSVPFIVVFNKAGKPFTAVTGYGGEDSLKDIIDAASVS